MPTTRQVQRLPHADADADGRGARDAGDADALPAGHWRPVAVDLRPSDASGRKALAG